MGESTTVSGDKSFGFGDTVSVTGNYSTGIGQNATASGQNSLAIGGRLATAGGSYSIAMGREAVAGGDYSMAVGLGDPLGAFPQVTGNSSFGIFMGDQTGVDVSAANTMALLGGKFVLGATAATTGGAQDLEMDIEGDLGAVNYCDNLGDDCFTAADVALLAGGGSPAPGADRQIVYNSGGLFDAATNFVYTSAGDFIVGSYQTGDTGTGSEDKRMFFDVSKGAFRAGSAQSVAWNDTNVGQYSTAFGYDSRATQTGSFAAGFGAWATGGGSSIAMGNSPNVSGDRGVALGWFANVTGHGGVAIGENTKAFGANSLSLGGATTAGGEGSIAMGRFTSAGDYAMAVGLSSTDPAVDPVVTGQQSLGIFMGDQSGYDLSTNNRMALVGGDFLIDDDGTSGSQGCFQYDGASGKLQFSHDCTTYYDIPLPGAGGLWTDNGTHISYQSSHIIKTGQTLPATMDDNGTRMFFYADKGAFRGGAIAAANDAWQDGNIGTGSFAWGTNAQASNTDSVSIGYWTDATGQSSVALGRFAVASGSSTVALGYNAQATSSNAVALGNNNKATGQSSTAMGLSSTAGGQASTAMGYYTSANGLASASLGRNTIAQGDYSVAFGLGNAAGAAPQVSGQSSFGIFMGDQSGTDVSAANTMALLGGKFVLGATTATTGGEQDLEMDIEGDLGAINYCDNLGDDCFTAADVALLAGGGSPAPGADRQIVYNSGGLFDAATNFVYTSAGDFIVGSYQLDDTTTGSEDNRMFFDVSKGAFRAGGTPVGQWDSAFVGDHSFAAGYETIANGTYSVAMGSQSSASNTYSVAMGNGTTALGVGSFAMGQNSVAGGISSVAMGHSVSTAANYSMAFGREVNANAAYSVAFGLGDSGVPAPQVSGTSSFGIFMGNQASANVSAANTMALLGGKFVLGATAATTGGEQDLEMDIEGDLGAVNYCDNLGDDCFTAADVAALAGGSVPAPGSDSQIVYNSGNEFYADGNLVFSSMGRLGIGGISDPQYGLQIKAVAASSVPLIGIPQGSGNTNWTTYGWVRAMELGQSMALRFKGTANPYYFMGAKVDKFYLGTTTIDDNSLAPEYRFVMDASGNIGLGTENPAVNLDVVGAIRPGYATTCTATEEGAIRYDSSSNHAELCDGSSWLPVNTGAGGLWTDNTTHISYNSAHFINSGETLPAEMDDDGARMFYYADKSAFRGGAITAADTAWQDANTGINSFAWGENVQAGALRSAAFGYLTEASGNQSFVAGRAGVASGNSSIALGHFPAASGQYSVAMGDHATANGASSVAMGHWTTANGDISTAMGSFTSAGDYSMAIGLTSVDPANDPQVSGQQSLGIFMGDQSGVDVSAANTMALLGGKFVLGATAATTGGEQDLEMDIEGDLGAVNYCDNLGNDCFTAGDIAVLAGGAVPAPGNDRQISFNSNSEFWADNNFVYTSAGDFIVGSYQLDDTTTGSEDYRMFFDVSKGAFRSGVVNGSEWDDANVGNFSTALGALVTASQQGAVALGYNNVASGSFSTVTGSSNTAIGGFSTAMGYKTSASGTYGISMGRDVVVGDGVFNSGFGDGSIGMGLMDGAVTITTKPQVTGIQSFGIFMGDQDGGIDLASANTMLLAGGRMVIDPNVPATNLEADTAFEVEGTIKMAYGGEACDALRAGAIRYDSGSGQFDLCDGGGTWTSIATSSGGSKWQDGAGDDIYYTSGDVGIGTATPAEALDVSGSIQVSESVIFGGVAGNAPTNNLVDVLNDLSDVSAASPNSSDVLVWNGSNWVAQAPSGGGLWTDNTTHISYQSAHFINVGETVTTAGLTGAGIRMFFYPDKQAFRAGAVTGTQWDEGNVGQYSTAFGSDATASGWTSFAAGGATTASNNFAVALGYNATASAINSAAIGFNVTASGQHSKAIGEYAVAAGLNSIALGKDVHAGTESSPGSDANYSFAFGLGAAGGTLPVVTGDSSFGIFMGDQSGVNLASANTMALMGGKFVLGGVEATAGGEQDLEMDIEGDLGAVNYCDNAGNNCFTAGDIAVLSGGAVPAPGNDRQISFNSNSEFWADNNFVYTSAGYLGIGTATPDVELDVAGDIEYTGTITDVSDRRLKTDIIELDTDDVVGKLMQVDTYSFRMIDNPDGPVEYGVMAQELETLFPNLVRTAKDEMGTKSVNYVGLIAPLIETSQALKAENDNLKTELASLQAERTEMHAALDDLRQDVNGLKAHTGYGIGKAGIGLWILLGMAGGSALIFFAGRVMRRRKV
ncbi:MAG: tail fiber domain-containing protein [Rhodospirillales bacterium]|nr:tail fiber domain-containing protein [Rhodospirillales bacterium]